MSASISSSSSSSSSLPIPPAPVKRSREDLQDVYTQRLEAIDDHIDKNCDQIDAEEAAKKQLQQFIAGFETLQTQLSFLAHNMILHLTELDNELCADLTPEQKKDLVTKMRALSNNFKDIKQILLSLVQAREDRIRFLANANFGLQDWRIDSLIEVILAQKDQEEPATPLQAKRPRNQAVDEDEDDDDDDDE